MIRILRAESPLQFFIDLIVSVFQCDRDILPAVRPSVRLLPLTGKMPGRFQTLPPFPFPPSVFLQLGSSARYCCISSHSRLSFSAETIVRRKRRTNALMRGKRRRERCGRADKGREAHSDGTSFSRSGSCCGPKHKTTQSNTNPNYISLLLTYCLSFVPHDH